MGEKSNRNSFFAFANAARSVMRQISYTGNGGAMLHCDACQMMKKENESEEMALLVSPL